MDIKEGDDSQCTSQNQVFKQQKTKQMKKNENGGKFNEEIINIGAYPQRLDEQVCKYQARMPDQNQLSQRRNFKHVAGNQLDSSEDIDSQLPNCYETRKQSEDVIGPSTISQKTYRIPSYFDFKVQKILEYYRTIPKENAKLYLKQMRQTLRNFLDVLAQTCLVLKFNPKKNNENSIQGCINDQPEISKMKQIQQNSIPYLEKNVKQDQVHLFTIIGQKNLLSLIEITKHFREIINSIQNPSGDHQYYDLFQLSCIRYLLGYLLDKVNSQEQLNLRKQIQALLATLSIYQQPLLKKYQLSYQMEITYKPLRNLGELPFDNLDQLFEKLFIKQSQVLLRLDPQIWQKIGKIIFQKKFQTQQKLTNFIDQLLVETQSRIKKQEKLQKQQSEKVLKKYEEQQKKFKIFLQKRSETPLNSNKAILKIGIARFKHMPSVENIMLLETNLDLIAVVCECQAYESPFLLFLVPFTYLLAETLSYYELESSKNLTIYNLYQELMKKINFMKSQKNTQISQAQLMDHIINFVNYAKYTSVELCEMMGQFLKKHGAKMQGFIPVYYDIFQFHAFQKRQFINQLSEIEDMKVRRSNLLKRIDKLFTDCQRHQRHLIQIEQMRYQ